MKGTWTRFLLLGLVSVGIILLDQVTKIYVMHTMRLHESIPIMKGYFSMTYIRNPGAAFGLLASASSGFRTIFFGLTSIVALVLLATIFYRMGPTDRLGQISVAAILGGAIGNLLDRVQYGEVIDFLDFYVGSYHWPAFNVADAAISVGVLCLIYYFALEEKHAVPDQGSNTTAHEGR